MKIYISGKITGLDYSEALKKFEDAEFILKSDTVEVVNPMTIKHDHDKSWGNFMREDIKALLSCCTIFMLDNWRDSRGAKIEHQLAKDLEMKIIYQ